MYPVGAIPVALIFFFRANHIFWIRELFSFKRVTYIAADLDETRPSSLLISFRTSQSILIVQTLILKSNETYH